MRRWVVALVVMTLLASLSAATAIAQEGSGYPGTYEYERIVDGHHVQKAAAHEGIEALPETGGVAPLLPLGVGVALIGCSLLALRLRKQGSSE